MGREDEESISGEESRARETEGVPDTKDIGTKEERVEQDEWSTIEESSFLVGDML